MIFFFKHCRASKYFTIRHCLPGISMFVLAAFLNLAIGCSYYKVNTYQQPQNQFGPRIDDLKTQQKVFVLHMGENAWWLRNIMINEERTELHGIITELPFHQRMIYFLTDTDRLNRYRLSEKDVLQQVHIHTLEYTEGEDAQITIPLKSIQKIEVYDPAHGATIASWVFTPLGVIGGALGLLVLIIALTKSSCPFIYTFDGEGYAFSGEIFSGATQPGLERHDYLMLPELKPAEGQYLLKASNEVREIQHINLMELKVIDHPADMQVLIDKYGQTQTILNPTPPIVAETLAGNNILPLISVKDSLAYYFDDSAIDHTASDGVILTFDKPEEAAEAKLVIRARNSFWLEHVFTSFHEKFGRRYDAFSRRQDRAPADELRAWTIDQKLPLSVYIEKDDEWVLQDLFEIAGPMAMKDDILPIDLEGIDSENIKIKLETGFLFWEIDYVAMDFTANVPVKVTAVPVEKAIDENGIDLTEVIASDNGSYYIQPDVGNEATLTFPVTEYADESRTLILHSKGFYKVLREQGGRPDRAALKTFRQPGRLPEYSKELYEQMVSTAEK